MGVAQRIPASAQGHWRCYLRGRLQANRDDAEFERELLVAVAEHQDKAAFSQLCRRYMPRLRAFLRVRCGDEADALTQEVMLTLWRKAKLYAPERAAPSTWIFTIARNRAIDHARRRRPEPSPHEAHFVRGAGSDEALKPDEGVERQQRHAALHVSLTQLPREQRDVLDGVYMRALTLREVASELEIPLGTAKSRVRLALTTLRRHLAHFETCDA